jgi:hypothetical protein
MHGTIQQLLVALCLLRQLVGHLEIFRPFRPKVVTRYDQQRERDYTANH